jgi:hypothetical protein
MVISIAVRLNGILSELSPTARQGSFNLRLPDASSIEDAVRALALPEDEVGLAAIGLRVARLSETLHDGDDVILFPRLPYGG